MGFIEGLNGLLHGVELRATLLIVRSILTGRFGRDKSVM
ncbi:Uncharacterised protein [Vibrio cholerae]|nr:Uncharacterised protein [Vibrio cholerae]